MLHCNRINLRSLLATEVRDLLGNSALTLPVWEQCFFLLLFPYVLGLGGKREHIAKTVLPTQCLVSEM